MSILNTYASTAGVGDSVSLIEANIVDLPGPESLPEGSSNDITPLVNQISKLDNPNGGVEGLKSVDSPRPTTVAELSSFAIDNADIATQPRAASVPTGMHPTIVYTAPSNVIDSQGADYSDHVETN